MTTITALYQGHEQNPGGCEIYRVQLPLYHLSRLKGWQVGWDYAMNYADNPAGLVGLTVNSDVIVLPRWIAVDDHAFRGIRDLINMMHDLGKKVVYEVDDDYTNQHRNVHEGDAIAVAELCDAITVTTPYLGEMMTMQTGRPHYILPNMLTPELWRNGSAPKRTDHKSVVIGLTGSPTHREDWGVLAYVLPKVADVFPEVQIILGGYQPDYFSPHPRIHHVPPLAYKYYADIIRGCDIILAPVLPEDRFNDGKSPIKAVEGMGATRRIKGKEAGAAVIATDNKVYRLAIEPGKTGLLVQQTPEAWYNALCHLVSDKKSRQQLQLNAHQHAWKHFDITSGAKRWAAAYSEILN